MLRKDRIKGLSDGSLGHGKSRTDRVCGVAEKCKNTLLSELCQSLEVCHIAEYRSVINLEVSGMHDDAGRSEQCQCRGIRDAVVGLDELHAEAAKVHRLAVLYHLALSALHQVMLF